MAINFNKLPSDTPYAVPKAGFYLAKITKAEMKNPKDTAKPPYLNLTMKLTDGEGKSAGNLFDGQYESEAAVMQFKLQRFMTALGLTGLTTFELKDLIKLVADQELVVEVENTVDNRDKDLPVEKQRIRAQARLFGSDIYWHKSEFRTLLQEAAGTEAPDPDDKDVPFDFDAADGEVPPAPPKAHNEY